MYYPKERVAFVAINKTGSSSILTVLNKGLYSHDVPETWQRVAFHPRYRVQENLKHAQAYFYYHFLGESEYSKCYTFSQVRNPFDKVVSAFIFQCRTPRQLEEWKKQRRWFINHGLLEPTHDPDKSLFKLFVGGLANGDLHPHPHWPRISRKYDLPDLKKAFINQLDGLTDLNGKIMVDDIFRLEDMPEDWHRVQNHIRERNGKQIANLPHVNKSKRDTYQSYYDEETYETVSSLFKDDLTTFDYKF